MKIPALVLMTRWPAAYRCKTRLATEIGAERAAYIQKKLISHTISVAKPLREKGLIEIYLAISGLALKGAKRWGRKEGIENISLQGKGSLGLRMRRQIIKTQINQTISFKTKRTIILIGTDLPSLCERDLLEGIEALKSNDIVIGPSQDGGYWFIGFSEKLLRPYESFIFSGIKWGGKEVLEQTIQKAKQQKVKYQLLNQHNDLDQLEDLSLWQK